MASKFRNDPELGPSYEEDFSAWAFYQAMLVRSGRLHLLDRAWIAEELDSLGRGEYRRLRSALTRVLQHMLKWDHQPALRSNSWVRSINSHRVTVAEQFDENPSLRPRGDEVLAEAYAKAVAAAAEETGLDRSAFPISCPYDWVEITSRRFDWPEGLPRD